MNVKILLITLLLGWSFGVGVAQTDSTIIIRYDAEASDDDGRIELEQDKMDDFKVSRADSLLWEFEKQRRAEEEANWTPDLDPYFANYDPVPAKAVWYAALFPGGGQIYNRKYWKLPIVYGGFVGCAYAMRWNNQMYHDYSQAYLDIMDDDPKTESYNQFMHLGAQVNATNLNRYQELFRKRKDRYRRWRDLSFFVMVGVYALSVVDAYVDASLSEFDISDDLSLSIAPTVIGNQTDRNPLHNAGIGMQCSLSF